MQRAIDAILDATGGLWQAPWYLFSPRPPSETISVTATFWQYNTTTGFQEIVDEWSSPHVVS
jgi:hypothetical protein